MRITVITTAAAAVLLVAAAGVQAQEPAASSQRIRIHKELPAATPTTPDTMSAMDTTTMSVSPTVAPLPEWYRATSCPSYDTLEVRRVAIKTDLYVPGSGMISPDSAKALALCAVPGQVGSGEMNNDNGIVEYAIDVIPNKMKTHTKVIVDANSGAVISSKQFGGLRGVAGWVRESAEHRINKGKGNRAAADSVKAGLKPPPR